jgi:glycosyltransferase involved in cell wall biosynthesis
VAFWGHGRNYQAARADGPRERWKAWWLRHVDWWFAYTDSSAKYVTDHGFDSQRVTVLQNAIDTDGFAGDLAAVGDSEVLAIRAALGIAAGAQVAIYCGSIYAEKRISVLLEAADLLRAGLPDFHLLVVGEGPQADDVRAAAATRPWLHVRGVRKGRDKAMDYRLASVMLNPGLVGLHIVDSFVAGTPLVTQASALHSPEYDYLENGVNGISVNEDSAAAYADAVMSIYRQEGRLARMRARCTADARRYTLPAMAANFTDGIVACLKAGGRMSASR